MRVERLRERLHSYVQARAWDAAELTLARWSSDHPDDFEPALHACQIQLQQGRYRHAFETMAAAVSTRHCRGDQLIEGLLALQELASSALMPRLLQRCTDLTSVPVSDLARAASVLLRVGLSDEASALLQQAVQAAPDSPAVLLNRGFLHFYRGETALAEAVLERLINGPQDVASAHWLLSRQRRQSQDANHIVRLRQRLSLPGLHGEDRADLGFALFKELDDLGETTLAWPELLAANALLAKQRPYDPVAQERRIDHVMQAFANDHSTEAHPPQGPTPVFIVGMHRSGTSLLEHLLSALPGVLACGETQRLQAAWAYACDKPFADALRGRSADVDAASGAAHFFALTHGLLAETRVVTEKWPLNFHYIGLIRRLFPHARVIHLCREPMDLCFANFRERLADQATHQHSFEALAHFHRTYRELMAFWHRRYPGFILDVHYEELVQDTAAQMQRVSEFCGLQTASPMPNARPNQTIVATPSAAQVRTPVHTGSIGQWRRYETQLAPLARLLSMTAK